MKGEKVMTQKERVLAHLKAGKKLTRLNAWDTLGIIECPARISELRNEGHDIRTTMFSVKNRYGEPVRIARWWMP